MAYDSELYEGIWINEQTKTFYRVSKFKEQVPPPEGFVLQDYYKTIEAINVGKKLRKEYNETYLSKLKKQKVITFF